MSTSDEDLDTLDSVIRASKFESTQSFWSWVKGIEFASIPITKNRIRVKEDGNHLEDEVVGPCCPDCKTAWDNSGLQASLQGVVWKANVPNSQVFWYVCMFWSTY